MFWFFSISVDDDTRRIFVQRLCRAIELAGLTEQQACAAMLIKPSQWCAQKNGTEHISYTRMMLLPRDVWRYLAVLTAQDDGLPLLLQAAVALGKGNRAMLRMENERTERRRTA
jgi:hypothetical protein